MDLFIDRRLRRDLFWFISGETEFFENPSMYPSASHNYRQTVESSVPSDWWVGEKDIWLHAVPPEAGLPLQGFKIHISGTSVTATELLRKVVPVCVEGQAGFKVIANPYMLEMTTCKNYSRGSSGKFMTIYP